MSDIHIDVLEDRSSSTPSDQGFLRVRRLVVRARYNDGTESAPFRYDVVDRDALDAVLIVLHADRAGAPHDPNVCLRTALRPPIALRATRSLPVADRVTHPVLWELPAGLIEPDAVGDAGIRDTASRETEEETGYVVAANAFAALGVPVYLSPGLCPEKIHVLHARINSDERNHATATETVEQGSRIEWVALSEALAMCARGDIEDCKTELALRRLRDQLARTAAVSP